MLRQERAWVTWSWPVLHTCERKRWKCCFFGRASIGGRPEEAKRSVGMVRASTIRERLKRQNTTNIVAESETTNTLAEYELLKPTKSTHVISPHRPSSQSWRMIPLAKTQIRRRLAT